MTDTGSPRLTSERIRGSEVGAQPRLEGAQSLHRHRRNGDAFVGILIAVIATSNLVQGIWTARLPALSLTGIGLALSIPVTLLLLGQIGRRKGFGAFVVLCSALAIGYLPTELNPGAADKRAGIAVTVVYVTFFALVGLTNVWRVRAFFSGIGLAALVVVVAQFLVPDATALGLGRRTPENVNAIGAGRAIGAALVLTICFVAARRGVRRIRYSIAASGPLLVGLLLAGSRGPVLGVLAAAAALVWMLPSWRRGAKVVITGALAAAGYLAHSQLAESGSRLAGSADSGRGVLYSGALRVGAEHPLGIGWGNLFNYMEPSLISVDQGYNQYPHNVLLEFFVEAGWASAGLLLLFLVLVLRRAMVIRHSWEGLALSCLAVFSVASALLSSDIVGNRLMWVSLAGVLAFDQGGGRIDNRVLEASSASKEIRTQELAARSVRLEH